MDWNLVGTIVSGVVISSATLFGQWLIERWKRKNEPDLSDPDFEDNIKDLLDLIKEEVGAIRVSYWEGSNGNNTLSGYHIKKLSMMGESNSSEYHDIRDELQMIPITTFKRNMDLLRESEEGVVFSPEVKYSDDLANLNKGYGVNSVYLFKVNTVFNKWTGVLMVGFSEVKLLEETQIAWLKTQSSRIATMIKTKIPKKI